MKTIKYKEKLEVCAQELIIKDGLILIDSVLENRDPIFLLSMIPYLSLFCKSTLEFLGIEAKPQEAEIIQKVSDIRNGLKAFTGKYGKSKRLSCEWDKKQDKMFKEMLKFRFLQKFNIHKNLGVIFTKRNKIIFNTQLVSFIFEDPFDSISAYKLGMNLGELIAKILVENFRILDLKTTSIELGEVPKYGYIDFNTNKMTNTFNKNISKEDSLNLLHALTSLGFINNYFNTYYKDEYVLKLRITYITVHNTFLLLNKFKGHMSHNGKDKIVNELEALLNLGRDLISSDFRSCMMHYSLINKGEPVIKIEQFDANVPFCGLIESCFRGENYYSYFKQLKNYSKQLESYLESYFNFDYSKINFDW